MIKYFKKEYEAALDRFRTWFMHPGIRGYQYKVKGARISRYPAPGSEAPNTSETYIDYKTAYRDSTHNIRFRVDLHPHNKKMVFLVDGLTETIEEKLVRYGYLQPEQKKDVKAVEEAKKRYQEIMEESVDVRVHQDDFGVAEKFRNLNREGMAEYVANLFDGINTQNEREAWLNDLDEVYKPQLYHLKSLDMASDDPVYRQLVLDFEFQMNSIVDRRMNAKQFPVFKGNPEYWQVLDDSFDEENRRKVQATIKSYVMSIADSLPAVVEEGDRKTIKNAHHRIETIPVPIHTNFVK
jgi:hypothetical protein